MNAIKGIQAKPPIPRVRSNHFHHIPRMFEARIGMRIRETKFNIPINGKMKIRKCVGSSRVSTLRRYSFFRCNVYPSYLSCLSLPDSL
jgi:hypothetical protein